MGNTAALSAVRSRTGAFVAHNGALCCRTSMVGKAVRPAAGKGWISSCPGFARSCSTVAWPIKQVPLPIWRCRPAGLAAAPRGWVLKDSRKQ